MATCKWPGEDPRVPTGARTMYRCQRPAREGHDFCLFHTPLKEKNQDQNLRSSFLTKFRDLHEQGKWDFMGFEFPDTMDMQGWDFLQQHKKSQGNKPVNFIYARFGDEVRFDDATFGDKASFVDTTFGIQARFNNTTFGDQTDFLRATFGDEAYFGFAHFGDQVRLLFSRFDNMASFENAEFANKASFFKATFSGQAYFNDVTFGDEASFKETTFKDRISFRRAAFGNRALFKDATFKGDASFRTAVFGESVSFFRAAFEGQADWREIHRQGDAYFFGGGSEDGEGSPEVEILEAPAPGLIFKRTVFIGPALFHGLDLSSIRFQQVDLRNVSFLYSLISQTKFISCEWGKGLESRRFLFNHPKLLPDGVSLPLLRLFSFLRYERPRILFDELVWRRNRAKTKTVHYALGPFKWAWQALWSGLPEQQELFPAPPWEGGVRASDVLFEGLQLKKSLEESKEPIAAGDFHFAVMEMKREQAREEKKRSRAAILAFYKMVSGYGERYVRTLLWIALLVAFSAGVYWWSGDLTRPQKTQEIMVETTTQIRDVGLTIFGITTQVQVDKEVVFETPTQAVADKPGFMEDLLFSFQNILPFKFGKPVLEATSSGVRWLCFFETLFGTTLFTFFALALRRRFKR